MTPTLPSGVGAGDLLLIFVNTDKNCDPVVPAGYSTLYNLYEVALGSDEAIFYKIHSGTESDPVVSITSDVDGACCKMAAFRNVDPTTPFDTAVVKASPVSSSPWTTTPTITTVTNGAVVVGYYSSTTNIATTVGTANGFTKMFDTLNTTNDDWNIHTAYKLIATAAAATGWAASDSGSHHAKSLALRPKHL